MRCGRDLIHWQSMRAQGLLPSGAVPWAGSCIARSGAGLIGGMGLMVPMLRALMCFTPMNMPARGARLLLLQGIGVLQRIGGQVRRLMAVLCIVFGLSHVARMSLWHFVTLLTPVT